MAEYLLELDRAKVPGYISRYDDAYDAGEISGDYQDQRFARQDDSQMKGPHFRAREPGAVRSESVSPRDDSGAHEQASGG